MSENKNPIKFVKIHNIKSGIPQIIPLSTWERLGQENPKATKDCEFLYNCTEDGSKIDADAKATTNTSNDSKNNEEFEKLKAEKEAADKELAELRAEKEKAKKDADAKAKEESDKLKKELGGDATKAKKESKPV